MIQLYTGAVLGELTLRSRVRGRPKKWLVECSCGKRFTIPQQYLLRPNNPKRHCGHLRKTSKTLHNDVYRIWLMMLRRTSDPTHISWKHYGGRGIQVHPVWKDLNTGFELFLRHIGPRPSKAHTVDRIDNDGNYQPGNVKWSTASEQAANKRKKQLV